MLEAVPTEAKASLACAGLVTGAIVKLAGSLGIGTNVRQRSRVTCLNVDADNLSAVVGRDALHADNATAHFALGLLDLALAKGGGKTHGSAGAVHLAVVFGIEV